MRSARQSLNAIISDERAASTAHTSRNMRPLTPPRNRMPIAMAAITMKAPMSGSASSSRPITAERDRHRPHRLEEVLLDVHLAHHVAGGVHRHHQLGGLARLEVQQAERDPAPRAVLHHADVRHQHQRQQHQRGDEQPRRPLLPHRHRDLQRQQRGDRTDHDRQAVAPEEVQSPRRAPFGLSGSATLAEYTITRPKREQRHTSRPAADRSPRCAPAWRSRAPGRCAPAARAAAARAARASVRAGRAS